ncbi:MULTISPECIES: cell division protein ZipA [Vibrio]|uniref:Cell division protein ZipA n=2 Tax=Vibrio TaxID=662 RepID=A0A1E5DCB6_9VIBR|nr:cell division protein ZipA [Vibrio genomosp. F6]OEE81178.1 cell division protein ZipA [Vibrio genomosp. F6 str. FF-238]
MQELRFVLIIVGALAIAALLFHGLWTSKKEGKSKFGNKPLGKLDLDDSDEKEEAPVRSFAPEDDFEIIRKVRKEPDFGHNDEPEFVDPLIDHTQDELELSVSKQSKAEEFVPFTAGEQGNDDVIVNEEELSGFDRVDSFSAIEDDDHSALSQSSLSDNQNSEAIKEQPEPEMQVIVLNVHCSGEEPFVGTKLFDSMQQNGLIYGEMAIFHRHSDLSGTGKVLFSVANMMQPGTLEHSDPADFSTKGISFFMTLPCYGDAEQNFKLMLKTAQQIADDMSGNVLDEARNLITPDRIAACRRQIQEFKAAQSAK